LLLLKTKDLIDVQERLEREIQQHIETERRLNEKLHDLERQLDNHQATIRDLRETVEFIFFFSFLFISISFS